ncbi:MAG: uroporphyrinogen-III synthase [Candidatus Binatia bacterium]|nr:uroporphyrinogen-III synthase [Candidatus Binatia bacterium]
MSVENLHDGNPSTGGLHELVVVAFESRRAAELAEMIRRHGGIPVSAPAMRELPRDNRDELIAYVEQLRQGHFDVVILLTGVGLRTLVRQVSDQLSAPEVAEALRRATLLARGPKPVAALRELGLLPDKVVPEPYTWREILALVDRELPVAGKTVAVHEYGLPNDELLRELGRRGAAVHSIAIYRWEYPQDLLPLRQGIRTILEGKAAVAVFTSANQVHNVWAFVEGEFEPELQRWQEQLRRMVVASVGPVCSQALRHHGVEPDLEAAPPKMGVLAHLLARRARACLAHKRAA